MGVPVHVAEGGTLAPPSGGGRRPLLFPHAAISPSPSTHATNDRIRAF
jgi:hypothetical protein